MWFLDHKERLINLSFFKQIRCCLSKTGMYEIRAIDKEDKDTVIFKNEFEAHRDKSYEIIIQILTHRKNGQT